MFLCRNRVDCSLVRELHFLESLHISVWLTSLAYLGCICSTDIKKSWRAAFERVIRKSIFLHPMEPRILSLCQLMLILCFQCIRILSLLPSSQFFLCSSLPTYFFYSFTAPHSFKKVNIEKKNNCSKYYF